MTQADRRARLRLAVHGGQVRWSHAARELRWARISVGRGTPFDQCGPEHGTHPRANSEWWSVKLAANRARDSDTERLLTELGWTVVRVWEHETPAGATERVLAFVRQRSVGASQAT